MTAVSVLGSGPVAITSADGSHLTVPLNALKYDGGAVTVSNWPPPPKVDHGENALAAAWATYMVNQGELSPDNSVPLLSGPAFYVEAVVPGSLGDSITLTISNVKPATPAAMTTLDLDVDITDIYLLQTTAGLKGTIGIAPGGGSEPGLVYAIDGSSPLSDLPKKATASMKGTPSQAVFKDAGGTTVLTLAAPSDGGADIFDASIDGVTPLPAPGTFTLSTHWKKTVAGKTLADMAVAFAAVIKITAPPGDFGIPVEIPATPLKNGIDAGVAPVAAQPATLTVETA